MDQTPVKESIKYEYVTIKYGNNIYKIRKSPQENDEEAYDRAWYIANMTNKEQEEKQKEEKTQELNLLEKECLSHIYVNEKYYNIKY